MANKNNQLVVSYYENRGMAEEAAESLKKWDKANSDIKLGAVAVLGLDEYGTLKADEIGQRDTGKGALWGAAIGTAVGVLTAGVGVIPGLLIGTAVGGGAGALNHKSLGMTDEDRAKMVDQLRHGGAALAVMADDFEVAAVEAEMARLGGRSEHYRIPDVTAEELRLAAAAQAEAASVVDQAVDAASRSAGAVAAGVGAIGAGALAVFNNLSDADAAKLHAAGVDTASSLLQAGATPAGRARLAAETGLDGAAILSAVKKLDLMRIGGIEPKSAELLLASGVDSVVELATRNPENLVAKLGEVNAISSLLSDLPALSDVAGWIDMAKTLPRVIQF